MLFFPPINQVGPTMDLDRTNDEVFENTTQVVRAVMEMVNMVHAVRSEQYVNLVKVQKPKIQLLTAA